MGYGSKRNHEALYSTRLDQSFFKGTLWNYSDIWGLFEYLEAAEQDGYCNFSYSSTFISYLWHFKKYPAIERLEQSGFRKLIKEKIQQYPATRTLNWNKNRLTEIFRLGIEDVRALRDEEAGLGHIEALKSVRKIWPKATVELAEFLSRASYGGNRNGYADFKKQLAQIEALGVDKVKFLMYVERQKKKFPNVTYFPPKDYIDYIDECQRLNYDLEKKEILLPPNFRAAHRKTAAKIRELEAKKKAAETREQAKFIKAITARIAGDTVFAADGLFIKPLITHAEFSKEGRINNNCVASYWKRVSEGKTMLFAIRKEDDPDEPYYTLELSPAGEIVQNRGKHNCGATPEINAFAHKWITEIVMPALKKKPSKTKNRRNAPADLAIAV
jgi:hypothetical protein